MDLERFTDRARKTLACANEQARRLSDEHIGTDHLWLALIEEGTGVAATVLKSFEVDLPRLRQKIERAHVSSGDPGGVGKRPLASSTSQVVQYAIEESARLGHTYVGTEHLLLGLFSELEQKIARLRDDVVAQWRGE